MGYHLHFGRRKRKAQDKRTNFLKAEFRFICLESLPQAPKSTPHQALPVLTSQGAASETGSFSSRTWKDRATSSFLSTDLAVVATLRRPSHLVLLPTSVPGNSAVTDNSAESAPKRQAEAALSETISLTPTVVPWHTKG